MLNGALQRLARIRSHPCAASYDGVWSTFRDVRSFSLNGISWLPLAYSSIAAVCELISRISFGSNFG